MIIFFSEKSKNYHNTLHHIDCLSMRRSSHRRQLLAICNYNYICIHEKWSLWDCVTKLRNNRMFKESCKFINFYLAKHVLISPLTHPCTGWVNFDSSENYEIIVIIILFLRQTKITLFIYLLIKPQREIKYKIL